MKYAIALLVALLSLPACSHAQGGFPIINLNSTGTVATDTRCDPAHDTRREYVTNAVERCDKATRKWVTDPVATQKRDTEIAKAQAEYKATLAHHKQLAFAMASRVVTEKELAEVASVAEGIFDDPFRICGGAESCTYSGDYDQKEEAHELYLSRKFNDLLAQQFKLRAIATEHSKSTNPQSYYLCGAVGCSTVPSPGTCAQYFKMHSDHYFSCVDDPSANYAAPGGSCPLDGKPCLPAPVPSAAPDPIAAGHSCADAYDQWPSKGMDCTGVAAKAPMALCVSRAEMARTGLQAPVGVPVCEDKP